MSWPCSFMSPWPPWTFPHPKRNFCDLRVQGRLRKLEWDSNPRPPAVKTGALPLSYPDDCSYRKYPKTFAPEIRLGGDRGGAAPVPSGCPAIVSCASRPCPTRGTRWTITLGEWPRMDEFYLVSPDRGLRFETFKRASMVCSRSFHTHFSPGSTVWNQEALGAGVLLIDDAVQPSHAPMHCPMRFPTCAQDLHPGSRHGGGGGPWPLGWPAPKVSTTELDLVSRARCVY